MIPLIINMGSLKGLWASLVAQMVKNLPARQETWVQSLGWKKSPREWNSYPLQYSWLENSMDRGAWRGTFHGVAKSRHNRVTNTIRFVYCNGINNDSVAFATKLMNPYFFFCSEIIV